MLMGATLGRNMISGGTAGTYPQSYCPKKASWNFVYVLTLVAPPSERIASRESRMAGSVAGTPATLRAK